jgi:4-hydroxybenzoyl-CoA thioesterase
MTPFQWPLRVYIEDTDAGGIVYYVNYLKFIERARTEYLRSIGFDKQGIFNESMMFVVHSLQTEYLKPAKLDDALIATAQLIKSGKSFLLMEQKVYRSAQFGKLDTDSELLCRAEVKLACVDQQSLKPKRMPAKLLATIS